MTLQLVVDDGELVLREGLSGPVVADLQTRLNRCGILLKVDGVFGTATFHGVKRFQRARGLAADGVVGPETWKSLK